jgi:acyl transferase domain-containing protein/acyl carrier protein/aryl carrier-like protein
VSYIEAHGTGTSLGDPIEITGLSRAFGNFTQDKQFCAIGSAKSNIGHCESAAGIAGLTKVLLQMRHGQLAPSLHAETLNPHIDFANSPFVVQRSLAEWRRPEVAGKRFPRIAGLSSFGAGGSNAHIVIEEYSEPEPEPMHVSPALVVLSAKNEARLHERVEQLLEAIESYPLAEADLANMAYTLQVGREAMAVRLGFLADSMAEAKRKLQAYLAGEEGIDEFYRGETKRGQEIIGVINVDEELLEAIDKWLQRGKHGKLLDLWAKGLSFDWERLYGETRPRRIGLPAYPFARERYWVTDIAGKTAATLPALTDAGRLHPLLHRNTSNLWGQRFSSKFIGDECFLADQVTGGRQLLPGAYLELARTAMMQSTDADGPVGMRLENVAWLRPLAVESEALEVHVGLYPEDDGSIGYEIYDGAEDESGEPLIHGQGRAVLEDPGERPLLDLTALQARCHVREVSGEALYDLFLNSGLHYDQAHRGVDHLAIGHDSSGRPEVLARLSLPENMLATQADYGLHPSLMEALLQAVAGLNLAQGSDTAPLPSTVEEVRIWSNTPQRGWAWVRFRAKAPSDDGQDKFDIDLCDESGSVCVRLMGIGVHLPEEETETAKTVLLRPEWRQQDTPPVPAPFKGARWVVLCDPLQKHGADIEAALPGVKCLKLENDESDTASRYATSALRLIETLRERVMERPREPVLIQVVTTLDGENGLFEGLSGALRTSRLESPKLLSQMIGVDVAASAADLVAKLEESAQAPHEREIRYRSGGRQVLEWEELTGVGTSSPWRDGGIYLITGGAGGLGWIFAREIAGRVKDPVLVLTGRTPLGEAQQPVLHDMAELGARAEYRQADVTDLSSLSALVSDIVDVHGGLNGVIHSAGVIRDSLLMNKTAEEIQAVLAPKVAGTLALDQATRELALDFMILFGSFAGALGNLGQADYAAGNAFMDAFAAWRNEQVERGESRGRTLSIDWPLWREGGMRVDAATERVLRAQGVVPLATHEGVQALYDAWASGLARVLVVSGDLRRIVANMSGGETRSPGDDSESLPLHDPADSQEELLEKVQAALIQRVSRQLKVKPGEIDLESELSEYGFDSVSLTQFVSALNQDYGIDLLPTIVFEYPTVGKLASHLVKVYGEVLAKHLTPSGAAPVPVAKPVAPAVKQRRRGMTVRRHQEPPGKSEAVAVIGMSGRFPMSPDLETFWRNLAEGRDCISEIPPERWDWRAIYGDPLTEPGKTNVKHGGFIEGVDEFDPLFFGISPVEAETMDPQQRLLMMYVWKALEDAGYSATDLSGSATALFAGMGGYEYSTIIGHSGREDGFITTGLSLPVGPNRTSFFLNLHGPSEPVDTACSSSLVAIHRALRVLQEGDCGMAIAGGVNTLLTPVPFLFESKVGMLSPQGRCKTFSRHADGYARGEGVGILVLKRLSEAQADGDHIYGVIRGSAENHGGRAQSLTAPNPQAQAALLKTAYRKAGVDPRTVSYIEAHGTGTPLGDPIEIEGLKGAFKELAEGSAATSDYCGIGSVKSNIGHLELAAGVAGVIKVLLQLRHKTLVKSLHCEEINPYIQLEGSPFYIVQEARPWEALKDDAGRELPRRAGVSSFGFGGTNAHVVIEEYVAPEREPPGGSPALVVLSAKSEARLRERAEQLLEAIGRYPLADADLTEMAYTLQVGREAMEVRLGFPAESMEEVKHKLEAYLAGVDGSEDLYRGELAHNKDITALTADNDMAQTVEAWVAKGKYGKLLELWVKGLSFDWRRLYGETKHQRISLPGYPFAKERYWATDNIGQTASAIIPAVASPIASRAITNRPEPPKAKAPPQQPVEEADREGENIAYLIDELSQLLGIPPERLHADTDFADIGVDSLLVQQLQKQLARRFGEIPAAALFKYKSIGAFAGYLDERPLPTDPASAIAPSESHPLEIPSDRPAEPVAKADTGKERRAFIHSSEDIAVIGLSGRYPKAKNLDEFWRNLKSARDCIEEIPRDRWDYRAYGPAEGKAGSMYCKWGGFLSDADRFDAAFFSISPREAKFMDPQERIFLQSAAACFEDAGYSQYRLRDSRAGDGRASVGVFAGVTSNNYQLIQNEAAESGHPMAVNSTFFSIANRVSYFFNLRGPSLCIDTACSSSLFALHLACESIRRGECQMALAGGVNLSLHPSKYLALCTAQYLSSDGRCRAFGADGDGYVPGEGVGVALLKPLAQAEADGDHIYGVIKATAVNNDGHTFGYSVPNPTAQAEVIRQALDNAGIDARSISYVEAHGTGTKLGDPIEISGLTEAYGADTGDKQFCAIGSVKSNIGHLESAAGIAQLTKVLLQMRHKTLAPTLIYGGGLNPEIDFAASPFFVQQAPADWKQPVLLQADRETPVPRRAGISSFGAGGVNVHAIVEEYDAVAKVRPQAPSGPVVITLSAKDEARLKAYAEALRTHIVAQREVAVPLAHIAYTLQTGRDEHPFRLAFMAADRDEVVARLESFLREESDERIHFGQVSDEVSEPFRPDPQGGEAELERTADLWVHGTEIAWDAIHSGGRYKVSLPTYPFAGGRYWAGQRTTSEIVLPGTANRRPDTNDAEETAAVVSPQTAPVLTPQLVELGEAIPAERAELLVRFIQQEIAEKLEYAPGELPQPQQGFFDMGMESVMVESFRSGLAQTFAIELPATAIFDHPTIASLSEYICDRMPWDAIEGQGAAADKPAVSAPIAQVPVSAADENPELARIAGELQQVLTQVDELYN